jgi:glucose/arabinose dehydrogenase
MEGLDEIYAYGFRNPYRFSFDMGGSHMLLAGDAGQNLWEEVSNVVKGGNYGWNVYEGTHCFDAENPNVSPDSCPNTAPGGVPLRDPVIEYANARNPAGGLGLTVIGGYVYRGDDLPQFSGRYIFGDWSTSFAASEGTLLVAKPRKSGLWNFQILNITTSPDGDVNHRVLAFGQDLSGEVYVLTSDNTGPSGSTGKIYRLVSPSGK